MTAGGGNETVRAVVIPHHGGPEVLEVRDIPAPRPTPDEVLVEVASSALNRADLVQRQGAYPVDLEVGEIEVPGLELAGTVVEVGSRVRGWKPGDQVMALVDGGGQAQRVAVHHRALLRVPDNVGLVEAGSIPEAWITAWDALRQGGMRAGQEVLVTAGASGVGSAAIQLARAAGCRVIATASGDKLDRCREFGADAVIDHRTEDIAEAVATLTAGRGVDLALDIVGGDNLGACIGSTGELGTVVIVGLMAGTTTELDMLTVVSRRITIRGTILRSRPIEEKLLVVQQFGREVVPLFERGLVAPVIDRVVPVDDVAAAHERMEANANIGKIVLDLTGTGSEGTT